MALDPQLAELLAVINAGDPLHRLSPAAARRAFRSLTVDLRPPDSAARVGAIDDAQVAGAAGPLPARVYRPESDGPHPTVVLLHGGGFVIGDLDTHDAMARSICAGASAVVVSVGYRLAPEARFPAAAQDAIAAVTDVQDRLSEYGGNEVLAVAGDSAGGNLAAVATQHVSGVAAQLLIYPTTDMGGDYRSREENAAGYFLDIPTMAWFVGHYLDPDPQAAVDVADPLASPIRGELAGLPPAVVVTAEFDPLRDEGIAYANALAAAGVSVRHTTYPGLIHGFFDMGPWSPACQRAIDETVARFATLLAG